MMSILLALVPGFLVGVIVNLLADYLPARRYHQRASADPFVSRETIPPVPPFLPHRADGSLWPVPLWSGLIAALAHVPVFERRARHVITEIGLAAAFAAIVAAYGSDHSLPFLLFYAAVFAL